VFITFFDQYFTTILPQAMEVYIAARIPSYYLLLTISPLLLASACSIMLAWNMSPKGISSCNAILLLSALGFLIAHLIQGKSWSYHYYPSAALLLLVALDGTFNKIYLINNRSKDYSRQIFA